LRYKHYHITGINDAAMHDMVYICTRMGDGQTDGWTYLLYFLMNIFIFRSTILTETKIKKKVCYID
jgi:hypothetical protein